MGSEQSHPTNSGSNQGASNSFTTGDLSAFSASLRDRDGAMSPRQDSVCSDSEVPYVSYTIGKPIGDSPKKGSKPQQSSKYKFSNPMLSQRSASTASSLASTSTKPNYFGRRHKTSTLVVVNKSGPQRGQEVSNDTELNRLSQIPTFLPVMRASLSVSKVGSSVAKDPDILEKLDPRGMLAITQRYQSHFKHCAGVVSTDQAEICKRIREVDSNTIAVTANMREKQHKHSQQAEKLKISVSLMKKNLSKCHMLLNENLERLETLNNMLPKDDRLEPFVWTTG